MTIRFISPLLCFGALSLVCGAMMFTATAGHAQSGGIGIYIVGNPTKSKISDNESPRPRDRISVKSSKSNTSDRMGGGGGRIARPPGGGGGR